MKKVRKSIVILSLLGMVGLSTIPLFLSSCSNKKSQQVQTQPPIEEKPIETIIVKDDLFKADKTTGELLGFKDGITDYPKEIIIPHDIDGIEIKSIGKSAFENLAISSVDFTQATKLVEIKESAFYNCNIKELNLTKNKELKIIGDHCFSGNRWLTYVSNFPYSIKEIGAQAFSSTNINNIDFLNDGVLLKWQAFAGCENIKVLNIKDSFKFEESVFLACGNDLGLTINFIGDVKNIANGIFKKTFIKEITFPENLVSIGSEAFYGTKAVNGLKIEIPKSVSYIGESAFEGSNILNEKIRFWDNLELGINAFKNSNLTDVYVSDTTLLGEGSLSYLELTRLEISKNFKMSFEYPNDWIPLKDQPYIKKNALKCSDELLNPNNFTFNKYFNGNSLAWEYWGLSRDKFFEFMGV